MRCTPAPKLRNPTLCPSIGRFSFLRADTAVKPTHTGRRECLSLLLRAEARCWAPFLSTRENDKLKRHDRHRHPINLSSKSQDSHPDCSPLPQAPSRSPTSPRSYQGGAAGPQAQPGEGHKQPSLTRHGAAATAPRKCAHVRPRPSPAPASGAGSRGRCRCLGALATLFCLSSPLLAGSSSRPALLRR